MKQVFIYVCDNGWVLCGRPQEDQWNEDFLFITLDDCCVIRIWGTSQGLGELAKKGPLKNTILDPEGNGIRQRKTDIKRIIPCSKAWDDWSPNY